MDPESKALGPESRNPTQKPEGRVTSLIRRSQRPLWFKNCWRRRQQVFLQQNVHSIPSPRHDSLFYQVGDCWQKLTALAA
jgi:hypothetical protein